MTDETSCTLLSKIDGKYAKAVRFCCDRHDYHYDTRAYWLWLAADWQWAVCAWRRGGFVHKLKTACFALGLMSVGWLLYYDLDKALIERFPALRRVKDWMG